jgi:DNA-binding transcriptional MerR regulator
MSDEFTIDQLASRSGIPSRTIRQYQTAGLLLPPERKGRVGVYVEQHVERLAAISRLQERGYSLAGMLDLFESWALGRGLHHVIGVDADQLGNPEPAIDEAPVFLDHKQLVDALPCLSKTSLRKAATEAGLITRREPANAGWIVRSAASLAIVAELIDAGIAPTDAIALHSVLRSTATQLASQIADVIATIEPDTARAAFLRRNRAQLGKATVTLIVEAVGEALPSGDRRQIRIGAVRDQRTPTKPRLP